MVDVSVELTSKQKRRAKKRALVKAGCKDNLPLPAKLPCPTSGASPGDK